MTLPDIKDKFHKTESSLAASVGGEWHYWTHWSRCTGIDMLELGCHAGIWKTVWQKVSSHWVDKALIIQNYEGYCFPEKPGKTDKEPAAVWMLCSSPCNANLAALPNSSPHTAVEGPRSLPCPTRGALLLHIGSLLEAQILSVLVQNSMLRRGRTTTPSGPFEANCCGFQNWDAYLRW